MNKARDIVLAIIFTAFIFSMLLMFVLLPKSEVSYNEKRNLQKQPVLSFDGVFDGSFESDTDKYLTDHFPFRDTFVAISSYFDLYTGRNGVNGVYKGKDGYLINTPVEDKYFTANIMAIEDFAKQTRADTVLMIVPTAGSILEDKLPKNHMEYPDNSLIDKAYSKAQEYGIKTVDIRDKFKGETEQVYYKTDHHWTSYGAYTAYKELVQNPYQIADFDVKSYGGFYGTTYSKSALWHEKSDNIEIFDYPKNADVKICDGTDEKNCSDIFFFEHLKSLDKYPVFLDGNHAYTRIVNNDVENGKILIVKDSYANSLAPFLIRHYNTVDMVDLRYYTDIVSELYKKENYDKILFIYGLSTVAETTDINMLY